MTPPIRARTVLVPFAIVALVTLALQILTFSLAAAATGVDVPLSTDATDRWRRTGLLAPLVVLLCYGLLRLALAMGHVRGRRFAFLRRPQMLAAISSGVAALTVVLPAAVDGSLTWGGLILSLAAGGSLAMPGTAPEPATPREESGEVPL